MGEEHLPEGVTKSEGPARLDSCWARAGGPCGGGGRDDMNTMNLFQADCAKALETETDPERETGKRKTEEKEKGRI